MKLLLRSRSLIPHSEGHDEPHQNKTKTCSELRYAFATFDGRSLPAPHPLLAEWRREDDAHAEAPETLSSLWCSVSHTTRKPRANDNDGRDYHFVERPDFDRFGEREAFVEWAEVHGNGYGTTHAEIERARSDPGRAGMIFDTDDQGARQIRAKHPDAVAVFILLPSMIELERRPRGRATETEEVVKRGIVLAERSRRLRRADLAERLLRAGKL